MGIKFQRVFFSFIFSRCYPIFFLLELFSRRNPLSSLNLVLCIKCIFFFFFLTLAYPKIFFLLQVLRNLIIMCLGLVFLTAVLWICWAWIYSSTSLSSTQKLIFFILGCLKLSQQFLVLFSFTLAYFGL